MNDLFDPYSRRARLLPGAIVVLPITLLAVVLITAKPAWWSVAISVVGGSGLTYLGTQLIRSFGTKVQSALWVAWGVPPSTALLRFTGATNAVQVTRWHRLLGELCPDEHVPTEAEEMDDLASADAAYGTLVGVLIAKTRDRKQFGHIFDENCQYGFRRNLYGCRTIGLFLAAGSFVVVAAFLIARIVGLYHASVIGVAAVGVLDAMLWTSLKWIVTPGWVRESANAYASRLIEAVEVLKAT